MGPFERLRRIRLRPRRGAASGEAELAPRSASVEPGGEAPDGGTEPPPGPGAPGDATDGPASGPEPPGGPLAGIAAGPPADEEGEAEAEMEVASGRRRSLARWVERRATSVVSRIYESQADDLESRARRAVSSAYREQADDLEDRAVRVLRRALTLEADRIKETIEHSVKVKRHEVRLSLLVLIAAALIWFVLDWLASGGASVP